MKKKLSLKKKLGKKKFGKKNISRKILIKRNFGQKLNPNYIAFPS